MKLNELGRQNYKRQNCWSHFYSSFFFFFFLVVVVAAAAAAGRGLETNEVE